ncbi:hypothetical protein F4801DRAFT_87271 [Xylaria longipes]|nr:hypothetical protein F4801DRAFT_87271 [Xylaria longipes]
METNPGRQLQGFSPDCPYFQKASPIIDYSTLPMCRLIETLEDGSTFIADSFGDRDWIDITDARLCGPGCRCNELSATAEERVFAFTVKKTPMDMEILFHNPHSQAVVTEALNKIGRELPSGETPWNGFMLLKYRSLLATKLRQMQRDRSADPQYNFRVAILSLLVNGVLDDPQVFKSYDFFWLYSQGHLEVDDWDWFHSYSLRQGRESSPCGRRVRYGKLPTDTAECLDDSAAHIFSTLTDEPIDHNYYQKQSIPHHENFELLPPRQDNSEIGDEIMTLWNFEVVEFLAAKSTDLDIRLPSPEAVSPKDFYNPHDEAPEIDRNTALRKAIQSQNIVQVQNILQQADEAFTGDVTGIGSNHQATRAQNNTQMDPQDLLLAVRLSCIRSTKLLLSYGYDVNCQFRGDTPLSVAAIYGSDSLVRLLLHYGADVPFATLILKYRGSGPGPVSRINSLARSYTSHIVQKKFKCNQNLIRLRNNFWKEYSLMSQAVASNVHLGLISFYCGYIERFSVESFNNGPFFVEENVRSAWVTAVETMRGVCKGNIPRNTDDVLLFLVLAKSMIPIIDECGVQGMEAEFFADLSRWQLVFRQEGQEHKQFIRVVKTTWDVDVTQSRLFRLEDTRHFEIEILHIQDLTRRLNIHANNVFKITNLSELNLPNVQARWRARQATSKPHRPEEPVHHRMQDDTHLSFTNDDPCPPEINGANPSRPPEEGHTSEISQRVESPSAPNPVLVIILAGSIFGIILAFLLLLRSSAYCSTIRGLFPLATTVHTAVKSGMVIYDQTCIIRRTRELLELYLGSSTPKAHECTMTSGRRESRQQNTSSAESTDYDDIDQSSSSGSAFISSESGPALETGRTELKCPPSTKVKKTYCDTCKKGFGTTSNLGKHNRDMHENVRYPCRFSGCGKTYQRNDRRVYHEKRKHKANDLIPSKKPKTQW